MTSEIDGKTKALAFVCRICPFCITARMFPNSKYAAGMKKLEENCVACKAYTRVTGRPATGAAQDAGGA